LSGRPEAIVIIKCENLLYLVIVVICMYF